MAVGNFPGKTNCAAIGVEEGNINPKPIDAPILNIKTPGNEVSNCGMTNRKLNKANKNEPKMTNWAVPKRSPNFPVIVAITITVNSSMLMIHDAVEIEILRD